MAGDRSTLAGHPRRCEGDNQAFLALITATFEQPPRSGRRFAHHGRPASIPAQREGARSDCLSKAIRARMIETVKNPVHQNATKTIKNSHNSHFLSVIGLFCLKTWCFFVAFWLDIFGQASSSPQAIAITCTIRRFSPFFAFLTPFCAKIRWLLSNFKSF